MPKGEHLKSKVIGKRYSKEYQPDPKKKSEGRKRLGSMKEALAYIGNAIHTKQAEVGDETVDLTFEAQYAKKLFEMCLKGNVPAMQLMANINGWMKENKGATFAFKIEGNKAILEANVDNSI